MGDIRNRPSSLGRAIRASLRDEVTGLSSVLESLNDDLVDEGARYQLPTPAAADIDLRFHPELLPDFTSRPSVLIVVLDDATKRASPPNLTNTDVVVLLQLYLTFDELLIDNQFGGVEHEESTIKQACLDFVHAVRRCLDRFSFEGGLRGVVGVDDITWGRTELGIQEPPDDCNHVQAGTIGQTVTFSQEGLL